MEDMEFKGLDTAFSSESQSLFDSLQGYKMEQDMSLANTESDVMKRIADLEAEKKKFKQMEKTSFLGIR